LASLPLGGDTAGEEGSAPLHAGAHGSPPATPTSKPWPERWKGRWMGLARCSRKSPPGWPSALLSSHSCRKTRAGWEMPKRAGAASSPAASSLTTVHPRNAGGPGCNGLPKPS